MSLTSASAFAAGAAAPAANAGKGEDPIARLTAGNAQFLAGKSAHPRQDAKRIEETSKGQHPFATVLSCSDSRVPPEVLFDQGLGDVFSVRVAGNVADTDEIGSVEYGVDHLGTPVLVVLGHTKCGAVTAVATGAEVHGHIPKLVDNIIPAVDATKKKFPNVAAADVVPEAIKANVFQSMRDLMWKSSAIRERVKSGKTQLVGAVYDITSGKVEWLGKHPDEAMVIAQAPKEEPHDHKEGDKHAADGHGKDGKDAHNPMTAALHAPNDGHGAKAPASKTLPIGFAIVAFVSALGGGLAGAMASRKKSEE